MASNVWAGGAGCSASATKEANFQAAMTKAEAANRPVLVKVGTEWCSACRAFGEAATQAEFRATLDERVVLHEVDGEKGEGKELASRYRVYGYPTFLLLNGKGEVLDRWVGYKDQTEFTSTLTGSLADAMTLDQRLQRFQTTPNAADAKKIAQLRQHEGLHAEAVAYYRRAAGLEPSGSANYDTMILAAMAGGMKAQLFGVDEMRRQADLALVANGRSEQDLVKVAYIMSKVSMQAKDNSIFVPYLKAAIEGTEQTTDPMVAESRGKLLPDYALFISKDEKKAIEYKRASMPEGWDRQPQMLNNFAWWCFENRINLTEAETLARKGVELCAAGPDRANILDTLAEICNATGDCGDAVELIRQAIAEAPENPYFKQQLDRFETLLASQR
jgi:thioredoxin-like negative regulator of GroEL